MVEELYPLVQHYRFNPYRDYRVFSADMQVRILHTELAGFAAQTDAIVNFIAKPATAIVARPLAWDSAFFQRPMARIDVILGEDAAAREAILADCLEKLRRASMRHVSMQIDAADIATAVLLERHGFRLTGGTLTYVARPGKDPLKLVRSVGTIRDFRDGDAPEVMAIAQQSLAQMPGRFRMDANLPTDRVDAFYIEWTRRCLAFEMADRVLVSEGRDGRLLGFLAGRWREPVSTDSGVPILSGGLGACRPDVKGAYLGLMHEIVSWTHGKRGVPEAQTQNYNFAAIHVFESIGLRLVRSDYQFVLSLD